MASLKTISSQKHNHLYRTRNPAVLIEPRKIGGEYFLWYSYNFFIFPVLIVSVYACGLSLNVSVDLI